MGAPSGISSGVGFRHVQFLLLDSNGIPQASGTGAYEGIEIGGAKTLTVTDPDPVEIVHYGDDNIFALDVLPPKTPITAEMVVGKQADAVDAALTGVNAITVGEDSLFPIGTNQRGNEKQVLVLAYRQSVDTDPVSANYGKRIWQLRIFPRCYVIPRESGFVDAAEERTYAVRPQFVTKYPWGVAFTTTAENIARAQGLRGSSEFKPKIVTHVANNVSTNFTLPVAAASIAKIHSWLVNTSGVGTPSTATTLTTSGMQYTTAPTTETLVTMYETE
jgi:hypothetical protein